MKISRYWKAVAAAGAAFFGTLATAMNDDMVVTGSEWVGIALAVLSALGITYVVPNRPGEAPGGGVEELARRDI
ncbi:hypothetical protein QNO07_09330 [Streptomyces sp. 549]|uniref:hypothetical protein n=1 Tax=Streptomyces sp. 549 TaxID=3049076 RepID=UPI0024C273C7|nr:hypothetical protein [Streptomyces sp. 549]MDK1473620.1 hypothetical protein [Streptomyces sp. 549]